MSWQEEKEYQGLTTSTIHLQVTPTSMSHWRFLREDVSSQAASIYAIYIIWKGKVRARNKWYPVVLMDRRGNFLQFCWDNYFCLWEEFVFLCLFKISLTATVTTSCGQEYPRQPFHPLWSAKDWETKLCCLLKMLIIKVFSEGRPPRLRNFLDAWTQKKFPYSSSSVTLRWIKAEFHIVLVL